MNRGPNDHQTFGLFKGLCGYEIHNKGKERFSEDGKRGLWVTKDFKEAKRLMVVRSPIHALIHDQESGYGKKTAYISMGKTSTREQKELLQEVINECSRKMEICVAADKGKKGQEYVREIERLMPRDSQLQREYPENEKTWDRELERGRERDLGIGF